METKENESMSLTGLPTKHPKRRERIPEPRRCEAFFCIVSLFRGLICLSR
jgi:hypothetical protein